MKPPIKNMFFPGVSGFGMPDPNAKLNANIENDPRNLNKYRAPYQVTRLKVDTSYWKDAVAEAERPLSSLPYRVKMQTMYLDTKLNGVVASCMQKRKNLTLLKKFHICDDEGNTDEEATKLLETQWFAQMREYIADARYHGYSLITFGDMVNGGFPKVQIARRTDVSPDRECLASQPYIPTGINFNDPNYKSPNGEAPYDWSLWVTTPSEDGISTCGYGLLYKVAVYEIIMRALIGWNTDYTERFGQPTTVIKTVDNDDDERDRAEEAAQKLGSSGYLILNVGDDYQLIANQDGGTGWQSYDNLESRCKKVITTLMLGHEDCLSSSAGKLTTDDAESPQAQALLECETIDIRFEEAVINDVLLPKLIKLGIKIPIGKKYKVRNDAELHEENENKAKRGKAWADIATTLNQSGLKVDLTEFSELSGLKLTEAPPQVFSPSFSNKVKAKLNSIYAGSGKK